MCARWHRGYAYQEQFIPTLSGMVYSHSIVDGGFDEIS